MGLALVLSWQIEPIVAGQPLARHVFTEHRQVVPLLGQASPSTSEWEAGKEIPFLIVFVST